MRFLDCLKKNLIAGVYRSITYVKYALSIKEQELTSSKNDNI